MNIKMIDGVPHKQGLYGRYFYWSQFGEWKQASDQEKCARRFGVVVEFVKIVKIKKSVSIPPATPRRESIVTFLNQHPCSTVAEIGFGITAYVKQVAPLLNHLMKNGKVRKMAKRRCTKSNHQASQWSIK